MKLAILLATYNSEKYLVELLDSIVNQTYREFSLYIRDDGSTDSTLQILEQYAARHDNFFILSDTVKSRRAMGSFFWLLERVEADYYMFCDHDDIWLKSKVENSLVKMLQIEQPARPAIVCTDLVVVDSNLNAISPSLWSYMRLRPELLTKLKFALSCNLFTGCTMMINRLARNLSLPVSPNAVMHDSWIGLRVLAAGGVVGWISTPQILYRQHTNNLFGAQRVGRSIKYYISKVRNIGRVAETYRQNYAMASDAVGGKICWAKFLFYRFIYLIIR
ncbi:MAG: glycosyltransferase family 2 protein [Alistipes sp.]|nr:glycosyltransferase family 2 protein [Alistipes sp.]